MSDDLRLYRSNTFELISQSHSDNFVVMRVDVHSSRVLQLHSLFQERETVLCLSFIFFYDDDERMSGEKTHVPGNSMAASVIPYAYTSARTLMRKSILSSTLLLLMSSFDSNSKDRFFFTYAENSSGAM